MTQQQLISIIVPVYNEAPNITALHKALSNCIQKLPYVFELIFVDDGSQDNSVEIIAQVSRGDKRVHLVPFARNFGKEAAVSAGLHAAKGDAAIILDADLQHPPEIMQAFINKWQEGADVVVGVRGASGDGLVKKITSFWFYKILQNISTTDIIPHATDYRLLDRCAIDAFGRFTERSRMTRGLIDWMGFKREYIYFDAAPRKHGERTYSYAKLIQLAISSFTAHSLLPLKLAGYLGIFILLLSGSLGVFIYIEQYMMNDPYRLQVSGTALLALVVLFLVGVVLICLGLVALYIARIHEEVTNRPLYVVRERRPQIVPEEVEV